MRSETFLRTFGLCSVLFFLCDGTPPKPERNEKKKMPKKAPKPPKYTIPEENFILERVEAYAEPYKLEPWIEIAKEHKIERERKTRGFNVDRTAKALRSHFVKTMLKKNRQHTRAVRLTDPVKKIIESKRNKYTRAEDDFINRELTIYKGIEFYSRELWREIQAKHDRLRELKVPGFERPRTEGSLRGRFNIYMRRNNLIADSIIQRCPSLFQTQEESTPKSASLQRQNYSDNEDDMAEGEEIADEDLQDTDESEEETDEDEDLEEIAEAMLALK